MDISSLLSPTEASASGKNGARTPPRSPSRTNGGTRPTAYTTNADIRLLHTHPATNDTAQQRSHVEVKPMNLDHLLAPSMNSTQAQHRSSYNISDGQQSNVQRRQESSSDAARLGTKSPRAHQAFPNKQSTTRTTSTPQMDALADLASMQNNQQQTSIRSPLTAAQATAALGTTATSAYSPSPIRPAASRNATDQTAMSMQSNPAPRHYSTSALSEEDLALLNQTSAALHESSLQFQAHVQAINLLHKAFAQHLSDTSVTDSHTHELASDLRLAREAMDLTYPLGEDLWTQWINDERLLARSTEDHQRILDLCVKAISDEPHSAKLWKQYGQHMYFVYASANRFPGGAMDWHDGDRAIASKAFTWQTVNDVWERGVIATQWRLNDSNIVWDAYMEALIAEQARNSTIQIQDLRQLFDKRLTQPHATWDQTFQAFSTFVSANLPDMYEEIMPTTNQRAAQAKQMWSLREQLELKILAAAQADDRASELDAYTQYLGWEVSNRGVFSGPLVVALYERAVTRFPAEATLWEEYIEYLVEESVANGKHIDSTKLQVLERATRHCPWSGSLWSHRLLALEAAGKDFQQMERVKHTATRSGILELFGMEELLKVYIDWCGFLRRRAFQEKSTDEDDLDIAEVGIRSAIEHVREIGERMVGKDKWQGDPHYRLERIHIKFYTQAGNLDVARTIWKRLVPSRSDDYNFWYRYYIWEMVAWAKYAIGPFPSDVAMRNPTEATSVLEQAFQHVETMDMPESLLQMYLSHCEQHESVTVLQHAHILVRKLSKQVQARRLQEHEAQTAQTRAYYEQQAADAANGVQDVDMAESPSNGLTSGKRKFDDVDDDESTKKQKTEEDSKRDREHASVVLHNIPKATTTTSLRKFFRGVGTIVNVVFAKTNEVGDKISATVEFEHAAEAEYAQTRSGFDLDGKAVTVSYAAGTTLWVTNYPPEADEKFLREMFGEVGDITDIRMPSLQGNAHRRFCYIQFATPSQALGATGLEGLDLTGADGKTYTLQARISDPSIKEKRQGAMYEGREVIVKQLHFHASEAELKELFSQHGKIENVRIPRKPNGQSKGSGFVILSTAEEARAAAAALNQHELRGRKLVVEVATPQSARAKTISKTFIESSNRSRSGTPAAGDVDVNGGGATPNSTNGQTAKEDDASADQSKSNRHERTIYLVNIPDTVNDTRVRNFLEPYGQLRSITLRPDHQGAIAEFATIADAGKAEMRIPEDKHEFVPGKVVSVVSESEFRAAKPEYKPGKIIGGGGGAKKAGGAPQSGSVGATGQGSGEKKFLPSRPINRPGVGAGRSARGGRRGGLGFKSGVGAAAGSSVGEGKVDVVMAGDVEDGARAKKTNDDFRAMISSTATATAAAEETEKGEEMEKGDATVRKDG